MGKIYIEVNTKYDKDDFVIFTDGDTYVYIGSIVNISTEDGEIYYDIISVKLVFLTSEEPKIIHGIYEDNILCRVDHHIIETVENNIDIEKEKWYKKHIRK